MDAKMVSKNYKQILLTPYPMTLSPEVTAAPYIPPDDWVATDTISSWNVTIFADDFSVEEIRERLKNTIVTTTTKEWQIVKVKLAEVRTQLKTWNKSPYTNVLFPSTWSQDQIVQWHKDNNVESLVSTQASPE